VAAWNAKSRPHVRRSIASYEQFTGTTTAISDTQATRSKKILDQLAEELRSQYSLGFYPKHDMNYRKWHHVEIRARDPRLHIRACKDYFGGDSGK
jgi:hypothetical protein